jgi:hypothetical protein
MAEFFQLSTAERLDPLNVEANTSGLLPHLLEKDVWVVWSLRHLFAGPYADHLVFNGGTSLSKAYCVIRHFSEDVDPTYDIRAIAGDSVGDADAPLPTSFSRKPMQRNHHDELQLHRPASRRERRQRIGKLPRGFRRRQRHLEALLRAGGLDRARSRDAPERLGIVGRCQSGDQLRADLRQGLPRIGTCIARVRLEPHRPGDRRLAGAIVHIRSVFSGIRRHRR